jgi:nucleotide-binding universal stress UspA family protein
MVMLKKILAPTDLSDLSATGVRYATQLARDIGAELIIFHVLVLDETNTVDKHDLERHRTRLDDFVIDKLADLSANVKIRKIVDTGDAYGAILDCAENERVDLIAMSSHGRSGLSRMLIGSVTDKVIRGASCPVLVVPVKKGN